MADDRRTRVGTGDVGAFVASVADEQRRSDAEVALDLMVEVTGVVPEMWGPSIVGFGHRPYTTADGKERDWFVVGFSPRKANLAVYGVVDDLDDDLAARLGPHTTGKGCLYLKQLDQTVDHAALADLVRRVWGSGPTG
jgi:hypothetical protein